MFFAAGAVIVGFNYLLEVTKVENEMVQHETKKKNYH